MKLVFSVSIKCWVDQGMNSDEPKPKEVVAALLHPKSTEKRLLLEGGGVTIKLWLLMLLLLLLSDALQNDCELKLWAELNLKWPGLTGLDFTLSGPLQGLDQAWIKI